ncbi:MAG TPA: NUDIX domain-containing protein [Acidobacteriota bacterium]|nr:NUDIX domain-containing protein [Acidobacteriota bacterium]
MMTHLYGKFNADGIGIYNKEGVEYLVCIERFTEPTGIALVGGKREFKRNPAAGEEDFESSTECILREFTEESGLTFVIERLLGRYDKPGRDPRGERISDVFVGRATGTPRNEPGKTRVLLIDPQKIHEYQHDFVFDHYKILCDWEQTRKRF